MLRGAAAKRSGDEGTPSRSLCREDFDDLTIVIVYPDSTTLCWQAAASDRVMVVGRAGREVAVFELNATDRYEIP